MRPLLRLKEALRYAISGAPAVHKDAPWWDRSNPAGSSPCADAPVIEYVVDDRVFLLGLDALYRGAMKKHERAELLACAQRVAAALNLAPADVPVEGYYVEHSDLTTYFRLMRALQKAPLEWASKVQSLPEFRRLLAVTSSPIFGPPYREYLLPKGNDPLSQALDAGKENARTAWTVRRLTTAAAKIARDTSDYSLVGLAARVGDPVVLAALRESVVLYALDVTLAMRPARPTFVWRVNPELCAAAERFVDGFNTLFQRELPPPTAKFAHVFVSAFEESEIVGRCARLGQTPEPQARFYHWAVVKGAGEQLGVYEFWDDEIWTTDRYRGKGELRQT